MYRQNSLNHNLPGKRLEFFIASCPVAGVHSKSSVNFETGAIYRDCLIALPEVGTATVNLQVQHVSEISHGSGRRARCAYVDTPDNVLSLIQRYINKLELERKRKQ
jgi:flagellar brake protein